MISNILTQISTSSLNYTLANLHSFNLALNSSQPPITLQDYPTYITANAIPANL